VTIGFARFIFNFDARYFTMADEGMLGPGHIENTLKLYVELLQIWIEEIKQRTKTLIPNRLKITHLAIAHCNWICLASWLMWKKSSLTDCSFFVLNPEGSEVLP
jgi:hypothetical protein